MNINKKLILSGVCTGMLFTALSVGAASTSLDGNLYTKNPLTGAPQGYATTAGYNKITAKCTVSKSGYSTKSISASTTSKNGAYIETDWISGPTYSSSGTKFVGTHTGSDFYGKFYTKTSSKQF